MRARGFTYRQDCIDRVLKQYGKIHCEMCGKETLFGAYNVADWQVDHKVPLALGGSHDQSNLWMLCPDCAKEKNAADLRDIYRINNPSTKKSEEVFRSKDHKLGDFNG